MKVSFALALGASTVLALPQTAANTCSQNTGITAARAAQVKRAFAESKVVPDVVPAINPTVDFRLSYGSKRMNLGTVYNAIETLPEPTYSFTAEADHDPTTTKYTIIYCDPDAPGPALPVLRQFLHKIEYDVQPSCVPNQSPKTTAPYMPLTPLSVSPHRYTYLVFRQTKADYMATVDPITFVTRAPFDLGKFVSEGGLQLVGGNFMREGLGSTACALLPGCTQDGTGYKGPLNGTAVPANGIGGLLGL